MSSLQEEDRKALREGLANLPRAENHKAGERVEASHVLVIPGHRAALDPDRPLVVGNRGMGKSFWAHALATPEARARAAGKFPALRPTEIEIGFNASERTDSSAPTPAALASALSASRDPTSIWRALLVRIAAKRLNKLMPELESFAGAVAWTGANGEAVDRLLTELDDFQLAAGKKLVVVFDALDKLADDWKTVRELLKALLQRALAAQSYRALRLKLFIRRDQFDDRTLFEFTDGSKLQNTRVELSWSSADLYSLLFARLSQDEVSAEAFLRLSRNAQPTTELFTIDANRLVVEGLAGEFMGADKKRGRVFSWLPLHLSDARGEVSPRTFLTAWREAANHDPAPATLPVDHIGLIEGVRRASEDRLRELLEDYWWIETALRPLRGEMVPMERSGLERLWREDQTVVKIRRETDKGLVPLHLEMQPREPEGSLVESLAAIGIIEVRSNGKINVPDIFRVEAGIKRKGGVKPPRRA